MKTIVRLVLAAAAFATAMCVGVSAGHAYTEGNAPWCAVVNFGGDLQWQCEYYSVADCQPNVIAGNRGFCSRNPYYVAPAAAPPSMRHWHRKRQIQQ
jgi:hypothetical protein